MSALALTQGGSCCQVLHFDPTTEAITAAAAVLQGGSTQQSSIVLSLLAWPRPQSAQRPVMLCAAASRGGGSAGAGAD